MTRRAYSQILTALPVSIGLALLVWGCASRQQSKPRQTQLQWHDGKVLVTATIPQSPRQLDPSDLTVTVQDGAKAVAGAQVSVEITMPEMPMPENKVVLAMTAPGVYSGPARFTMAGRWKIALTIHMPDGAIIHHAIDTVTVE